MDPGALDLASRDRFGMTIDTVQGFNDGVIFAVQGATACDFIAHNFIGRAPDSHGLSRPAL